MENQGSTRRDLLSLGAGLAAASAIAAPTFISEASAQTTATDAGKPQTYVLIHGAYHSGDLLEDVAKVIRAAGHTVHTPTLAGNRPGDKKNTGLDEAIESVTDYFKAHNITDAILYGHSYGGMVITGAADRLPKGALKRLVYHSAYVPNNGESGEDISPPGVKMMFDAIQQPDGGLPIPYVVWRDGLMNDADEQTAHAAFLRLNPHPHKTMQDKIKLKVNPADMQIGKSYIVCWDDWAIPASLGGWQRMSERLGFSRFVSMPGSHEVCFSNPSLLGAKIIVAGRD